MPQLDEATGQFITEVFEQADALLLGRRTCEIFVASYRPSGRPEFGEVDLG